MKSRASKLAGQYRSQAARRRAASRRRRGLVEQLEPRQLMAGEVFVDNQVLVQFQPNVSQATKQSIVSGIGGTIAQEFHAVPNAALVTFATNVNEANIVAQLQSNPSVRMAELNLSRETYGVPNDPFFDLQWGHNNTGQIPFGGTVDADIDSVEAWDMFHGTRDAIVAVFDTGVDFTHPDLRPNLWVNTQEIAGDGIDNDNNGYIDDVLGINAQTGSGNPNDTMGHGTHVSGIVGAVGNDNLGVSGVNWEVQIMTVNLGNLSIAAIMAGVDYVVAMKARGENIVSSNHSYGGPTFSAFEMAAMQALETADILPVTAAGNTTQDNDIISDFPGGYILQNDTMISVAASNVFDDPASFSSYGATTVDLFAPGELILSTIPFTVLPTRFIFLGYDYFDGTSMASPQVAGAAALLRGLNPNLTAVQTKQLLLDTVDVIPSMDGFVLTNGRLNIKRAMDEIPKGEIHGKIYRDDNADGVQQFSEPGLGGWVVYTDLNNNGTRESDEPATISRSNGDYVLPHFRGAGTYTIREEIEPGFQPTVPSTGSQTVTVGAFGDIITGVNFGNKQLASVISGTKFIDTNLDGIQDPDELGGAGFFIYVDANNNGRADLGEPSTKTDLLGHWQISLPNDGTYVVREAPAPGFTQTFPPNNGGHTITITAGTSVTGLDFGNSGRLYDYGNAPDPYDNDAGHGILPGFQLGPTLIGEANMAASTGADNDGVTFVGNLFAGLTGSVNVDVRFGGQTPGFINAWVDFNQNGVWEDSEKIIDKQRPLTEGVHTYSFAIPAGALTGTTYARVRYSQARFEGPTGTVNTGECEDVALTILGNDPIAVDDIFQGANAVDQNSANNSLDVLGNDLPSAIGGLMVQSVGIAGGTTTTTAQGGTATISADKLFIIYTPRNGFFGSDSFVYTLKDANGRTDSATVTVQVTPTFSGPVAVDDYYADPFTADVFGDRTRSIRVLSNDLVGPNPPTSILRIVSGPTNGTAIVSTNGTVDPTDDTIDYEPNSPFTDGTDQLVYEIADALGNTSQARLTIQVGDATADDIVEYFVAFVAADGTTPITSVPVGTPFYAEIRVRDLRPNAIPAPPAADRRGVFAAFTDVLYDQSVLTVAGPIEFTGPYTNIPVGNDFVPGIIDEAGAFRPQSDLPPGGLPSGQTQPSFVVFRVPLRAVSEGSGETTIQPDPSDLLGVDVPGDLVQNGEVSGAHDTLIYQPSTDVELNELRYTAGTITITPGAAAEGEFFNPVTRSDVNGDRRLSPVDLALVIADLQINGSGVIGVGLGGANGEGESGSRSRYFVDTDNNGMRTPNDARVVLEDLMRQAGVFRTVGGANGEGEPAAEGEYAPLVVTAGAPALAASAPADTTPSGVGASSAVDQLFAAVGNSSTATAPAASCAVDSDAADDFFEQLELGQL